MYLTLALKIHCTRNRGNAIVDSNKLTQLEKDQMSHLIFHFHFHFHFVEFDQMINIPSGQGGVSEYYDLYCTSCLRVSLIFKIQKLNFNQVYKFDKRITLNKKLNFV